ncbi:diguanylate cyclase (GGDEF) domain-containing protein [Acidovorax sp. CF316]|uniref:diguanylate cyclase n=1 Tax=Acidovorax sp. CF316 TaxID=1144317 RepID=UPI00026BC018|nr:diguanylate cyclase [Acidovorax sp. CF316]EJE49116.1 diguanylate cyclase (GGDEF) domain-containing protein [Acidovorax sp. CF316]
MPSEIVHTIGCTIYFVFALLFLWMGRVPRTRAGPGWWAAAMSFALAARLAYSVLLSGTDLAVAVFVYAALVVVEKALLAIGLVEFLGLKVRHRWFWGALLVAECWVLLAWLSDMHPVARSFGLAVFNAGFLSFVAWTALRQRKEVPHHLMLVTALVSAALVVHWMSAFVIFQALPGWHVQGFLLGTVLVLAQYLSLLAAVLMDFQRRLVQAEASALDMAFQDPLTGLNNQRYMNTLFEKALVLANRPHQSAAVIFIDLDNFKPINDLAGHHVGDEVLRTVAGRLGSLFTVISGSRWDAIGMSGRFGCAAWAHAHASSRGVQSPDFAPTLRANALPGGLRRCGAC